MEDKIREYLKSRHYDLFVLVWERLKETEAYKAAPPKDTNFCKLNKTSLAILAGLLEA